MTNQHPITPPLELVQQWWTDAQTLESNDSQEIRFIANVAARWGADQELDACCEWLKAAIASPAWVKDLRAARRPKPPSLKEQALTAMLHLQKAAETNMDTIEAVHIIRRALEALPND
jgi:hypothetical protein